MCIRDRAWVDKCLHNNTRLSFAHEQGHLIIWMLSPDLRVRLRRNGLASLVKDLALVGFNPRHALFVVPANRLFKGLSSQQLQVVGGQLLRWCQPVSYTHLSRHFGYPIRTVH